MLPASPKVQLTVANVIVYPPGAVYGPRTHVDFEFIWLLSGSATWSCGGREVSLPTGSLLLAQPGMRDQFDCDASRTTRHAYVHFEVLDRSPVGTWPLVRSIGQDDLASALFRYILWVTGAAPDGWRQRAEEALGMLVATFVDGPLHTGGRPPVHEAIEAVGAYLREQWAGGVTRPVLLGELARVASLSTVQLCRIFRAEFGIAPVAAVERLRISHAEDLLGHTNMSVSAIAVQCGFADLYHFSRRFRTIRGMPPRQFRLSGTPTQHSDLYALRRLIWREQR